MTHFRFPVALPVELGEGRVGSIPEGLWPVKVSARSVRIGAGDSQIELDLDQWDSILRSGLAVQGPSEQ